MRYKLVETDIKFIQTLRDSYNLYCAPCCFRNINGMPCAKPNSLESCFFNKDHKVKHYIKVIDMLNHKIKIL